MTTSPLNVFLLCCFSLLPSPLSSSFLSSQASYNIASRKIFLKNKSSHITGQLSDCHFLPVGVEAQSACLPILTSLHPWVLLQTSHPEPLLSAHIPSPLSRMACISLGTSQFSKLDSQTAALVNILNFSWSHWLVSRSILHRPLAQHLGCISLVGVSSPPADWGAASLCLSHQTEHIEVIWWVCNTWVTL